MTEAIAQGKACIVGAGSSGLACIKILKERGLDLDCFEMGSDLGGNWRYGNDNGVSAAYRSLHINTSKQKMAYSDFPMPEDYPDFPHHTQVLSYFEDYAERFDLRRHVTFETEVRKIEPAGSGGYRVTVRDRSGAERSEVYAAVLVANGHHWCPRLPDFPGELSGPVLHSHEYTTPEIFDGRRVLVVGVGNSGCDIVCEAARRADATFLSTRRGAHVVPKYILGRPLDHWNSKATSYLPLAIQRVVFRLLLFLARGRQKAYGFPTPDYPFGSEHPTISSDLLHLVGHGRIQVQPDVERLEGDRVRFTDGSTEEIDLAVFATGYRVRFPFFDDDFLAAPDNEISLYRRVVHPDLPGLYFIGLIQPLGATMPLAEAQAEWVGDLLAGRAGLPEPERMRQEMEREREEVRERYVESPRHTLQVDFYPYLRSIEAERKTGRRHAPKQALQDLN